MTVDEKTVKWTSIYKKKKYYFCNPLDKEEFDSRPEKSRARVWDKPEEGRLRLQVRKLVAA